ncbi:MAG TPA: condensation domain-containing protein, partial [Candidatus Elarobacter sp.]|nr:condensation domain-containing protein [Candidatus Elarobacter sp.]
MTSTSDTLAERRREIETRLAALSPAKRALLQRAAIPAACSGSPRETIPRRPEGTHAPLSFAQELVWLLQQADPGMHGYNVPRVVRLDGALDIGALQRALDAIVERHEVLRTTLRVVNGRPVQVVGPPAPVSLTRIDLSGLPNNVRETEAVSTVRELSRRPFDLARDPLLRVTLITMAPDDHVLLLESHHVASDGWSRNILFSELSTLYEAFAAGRPIELLPLPIQYGDYAAWERATLTGARLDHSLAYWRERLAGVPPTLALPTDRPRPVVPSFEGAMQTRRMSPELLARLRALSNGHGATLFMTLLAAFDVLLARYSGESDIVVRSPIANRTHDA